MPPIYINHNVKRPWSVANITTQAEEPSDWREADGNQGTPEVGEWVEEGQGAMGMIAGGGGGGGRPHDQEGVGMIRGKGDDGHDHEGLGGGMGMISRGGGDRHDHEGLGGGWA